MFVMSDYITFSIRVPIEDRVRLKLLALHNNTTMSNFLHNLISDHWSKVETEVDSNIYSRAANKEFRRLLKK